MYDVVGGTLVDGSRKLDVPDGLQYAEQDEGKEKEERGRILRTRTSKLIRPRRNLNAISTTCHMASQQG